MGKGAKDVIINKIKIKTHTLQCVCGTIWQREKGGEALNTSIQQIERGIEAKLDERS
ncbi:hypothetical protein Hdeb2414_s0003g00117251 [Helianthus debilis subsp. tardiflorus]